MTTRYRGILFDLDGTLIDTIEDIGDAINGALAAQGLAAHSYEAYRRMVGNGVRTLIERAAGPGVDAARIDALVAGYSARYDRHCTAKTRLYPGVRGAVQILRSAGYRLGVLSNKPHDQTLRVTRALGLFDLFDTVYGNSPAFLHKPDPALSLHILSEWGLSPGEVIFIGDSDVDIATGKNAGLLTVGAVWGFRGAAELRAAGADFLAETPGDLPRIVLSLR